MGYYPVGACEDKGTRPWPIRARTPVFPVELYGTGVGPQACLLKELHNGSGI